MISTFRLFVFALIISCVSFGTSACQRHEDDRVAASGDDNGPANRKTQAISEADRRFMLDADKANVEERALGKLAADRAQSKEVKDFGRMLADDHQDALKDLVDLMDKHGIAQPNNLDEARNSQVAKFEKMSGAAFDREFVDMMASGHEKAIAKFKEEANSGQNDDVQKYAKNMLPSLEKHLDKAHSLQQMLSGNTAAQTPQAKEQTKTKTR
jgi:putative membrane protein